MATKLVLLGGAVTIVAAFLPWISVELGPFSESVTGIDGDDGMITLVLAAGAMAVAYLREWSPFTAGGVVVLGGLAALLGLLYISDPLMGADVSEAEREMAEAMASPEIGLYLTVLGGLVVAAGGFKGYQDRSSGESTGAAVEATSPEAEP
ncbi:hypothetical protein C479_10190 [Halovivax asiaticus JCM 14624]|uniref:Uncharacterized protein n=2 Tax=Halovivax asiaticus TaxID=332953 RepID=M0BGF7_9EURY|nr:hypothetical protein C479_10190 [Halovivax asiaticus JCM 14624]